MADKYTIQIDPQVSKTDAKKMENDLNGRFKAVSDKFGTHLQNSMRRSVKFGLKNLAGGLAGIAAGIAAVALSNPFQKINDDLNEILDRIDNTGVRAEEFGVSAGKYFQNETIAKSLGVEDYAMILNRYNSKLDEARVKTEGGTPENNYLQNFVGDKDVIDSFNAFAETMRHLDSTERNRAIEEVFGGKMGLRLAEVFQTDLNKRRNQVFQGTTEAELNRQIKHLNDMEDIQKLNRARLDISNLSQKSRIINSGTMGQQNQIETLRQARGNTQLSQYQVYADLAEIQEKALLTLEGMRADFTGKFAPIVSGIADNIESFGNLVRALKDRGIREVKEIFK